MTLQPLKSHVESKGRNSLRQHPNKAIAGIGEPSGIGHHQHKHRHDIIVTLRPLTDELRQFESSDNDRSE